MKTWKFREELVRAANRWYWIFASLVLGGLAGYLIAFLIPAPYQATADLFVGIDVVRVNEMEYLIPLAKEEPLNLDDYKNWQLKQVSDILTSPNILESTFSQLQEEDPRWEEVTLSEFAAGLDIYWYDTGTWRLEAVFSDPKLAEMAVKKWLDVGHQRISELLEISDKAALLDLEVQSLNLAIASVEEQLAAVDAFQVSSEERSAALSAQPQNQPLGAAERNDLLAWADANQVNLDRFPGEDQPASLYLTWLAEQQESALLTAESLSIQKTNLRDQQQEKLKQYHQALEDSIGLSANLVLLPNDSPVSVSRVRSAGELTLGGSLLGFLVWMIVLLFRVGGKGDSDG